MKKLALILLILWMGFIFYMSTDAGSKGGVYNTKVVNVVKKQMGVDMNKTKVAGHSLIVILRKNSHFFLYAVLGILIYNVVRHYGIRYKYLLSIVLSSVYALTDEFHQAFVATRTSSLGDVIIDTLGSLVAVCFIYIYKLLRDLKVTYSMNKNKS